jgi:hypothetical protein
MLIKIISRLVAGILVILAIGVLATAIWSFASQGIFFDPTTFKNGLAAQNIYADIVPVALPALLNRSDIESETVSIQAINRALPAQEWRVVANELVQPDWLQVQTEHTLDLFFAWINGNPNAVQEEIFDLAGLHNQLTGEAAQRAIDHILQTAPPCQPDEINRLKALDDGKSVKLPICHPPEEYIAIARTTLSEGLAEMGNWLRTQKLTLANFVNPEDRTAILAVPIFVQTYRQIINLFYLCPIGILALVVTLTVRSRQSFGRWIGITLIISGVLAILPLPFISFSIIDGMTAFLITSAQPPEIQLFQARLYSGLLNSAFAQFSSPVLFQAAIMVVVGLGLLFVSFWKSAPQAISTQAVVTVPDTASQRRTAALENPETEEEI